MSSGVICLKCGAEVGIAGSNEGTNHYYPLDPNLDHSIHNIPFYCDVCGAIKSPFRAIRDIAYIYPFPDRKVYGEGIIQVPDTYQQFYKKGQGVLLSIGPGYYTNKIFRPVNPNLKVGCVVRYNSDVFWKDVAIGQDGEEHLLIICGEQDIWWIEDQE